MLVFVVDLPAPDADDAERFALEDIETDCVDGLHDRALAAAVGEMLSGFPRSSSAGAAADVARIAYRRHWLYRDRHRALRLIHGARKPSLIS
jgi:hypothetical protein